MRVRKAIAALIAVPGLALGTPVFATTIASSTGASATGILRLCDVEDKTAVPAAAYAITGRQKPVVVKADTCRSLSAIPVGDVQIFKLPTPGQLPLSITVTPATREDGQANLNNGTVTVDITGSATTTVTYTNQT